MKAEKQHSTPKIQTVSQLSFVIKDNAIQVIFIHACRCDCKEGVGSLSQVALIKKKKCILCFVVGALTGIL